MSKKLSQKEAKEVVTKEFLYNVFKVEIDEQFQQVRRDIRAFIEDNRHQKQLIIESMNLRFERMEEEFRLSREMYNNWLSNHEERIRILEG